MATSTAVERVARYRSEFIDNASELSKEPRLAAVTVLGICTSNALEAIEAGDPAEALAWGQIAQVEMFLRRRNV